ncbi:unnamed protein product, partial [Urochloa humidicola]
LTCAASHQSTSRPASLPHLPTATARLTIGGRPLLLRAAHIEASRREPQLRTPTAMQIELLHRNRLCPLPPASPPALALSAPLTRSPCNRQCLPRSMAFPVHLYCMGSEVRHGISLPFVFSSFALKTTTEHAHISLTVSATFNMQSKFKVNHDRHIQLSTCAGKQHTSMEQQGFEYQLVELLDPPLHNYFGQNDCLNYFCCFRWVLIQFKRALMDVCAYVR